MREVLRIFPAVICTVIMSASAAMAQAPAPQPAQGAGRGGGRGRGTAPPMAVVPVDPHDLNGYWMLPPDPRDGREIPAASLVAGITRQKLDEIAAHDKNAVRYCNQLGLPASMGLGSPYNIRIARDLMVIVSEYAPAQNRWIYLNRTTHIPADAYDNGVYGHSIGHWEGNTLVVDTTMFHPDHGILSIPGGGFRTPDSKLVERFTMLKNGQVLQLVSTWTDPKVFRTPQTYEYRYNRVMGQYDGRIGSPCDPYDDARAQFLNKQTRVNP